MLEDPDVLEDSDDEDWSGIWRGLLASDDRDRQVQDTVVQLGGQSVRIEVVAEEELA